MKTETRILISGAGIAGLAAAIRLQRAGFKPVIVEKSSSTRAGGYLVALSHQAYRYADEMGLMPALKKYDLKISSSSYHDKYGHALLKLDYTKMFVGLDIVQLMRDDLAQVLYEEAKDKIDIRFGDQITAIENNEDEVKITFASGIKVNYDIVIGADGAHSGVRKLAFDTHDFESHYLDLHCAAFRLPNALDIHDKFETHMERNRYMATFTTLQDDIASVFVWEDKSRELPPHDKRKEHLLKAYENAPRAIQKALPHCPDNEPFYMDVLSQISMPKWSKNRCIVIGDAGHCLTLFSGRGAAAAFAGACRLTDAIIAESTHEQAFQSYEEVMRPVIDDIMPATRGAVKWYVPGSYKNYFLRDNLMRFVPNFVFRKYFQMKYSNV